MLIPNLLIEQYRHILDLKLNNGASLALKVGFTEQFHQSSDNVTVTEVLEITRPDTNSVKLTRAHQDEEQHPF